MEMDDLIRISQLQTNPYKDVFARRPTEKSSVQPKNVMSPRFQEETTSNGYNQQRPFRLVRDSSSNRKINKSQTSSDIKKLKNSLKMKDSEEEKSMEISALTEIQEFDYKKNE